MRAISLFAGIGGFDIALEQNGHVITDQVEIDQHAQQVLASHFDSTIHGDIHDFTPKPTDIVVGGFPCQDYSVAGSRGGLVGDRGALWWQMHRIIDESRPTWVIGENVPGLVSSNDGRDFRTIIESLVELGYGVVWRILDAQYFGVAQRRRRVFIVGHSGGEPRPEVLALGQGSIGDSPPSRQARQDVAPTISARTKGGSGLGTDDAETETLIANSLETRPTPDRLRYEPGLIGSFAWQAGGNNDASGAFNDQTEATPTLPRHQTLAVAFAEPGMKQQTYVATPTVRRLTPLECERLQGFPDNWTAGVSDTQRYRQLGNAVAVPVVDWIVQRLAA